MKSEIKKRLEAKAGKKSSNLSELFDYVEKSEKWFEISARVAMAVTDQLKKKNLTQKDLAEKMGVTPQRISTILSGKENITVSTIVDLEKTLGFQIVLPEGLKEKHFEAFGQPITNTVVFHETKFMFGTIAKYFEVQKTSISKHTYSFPEDDYLNCEPCLLRA